MEKLFKIPMLTRMYQARAEELEKYINNSNDNKNKLRIILSLFYYIRFYK